MARNRMLNPEFWLDEEVASMSAHARLLYMGLWGICDDNYATLPNRSEWIKAQIFPYESDIKVKELLKELEALNKIVRFKASGKEFWYIKNFHKYQRIDRPSNPKFPPHPEGTPGVVEESSTSTRPEVKLSKDKLSKKNLATLTPLATRGALRREKKTRGESPGEDINIVPCDDEGNPLKKVPSKPRGWVLMMLNWYKGITGHDASKGRNMKALSELAKAGYSIDDIKSGYEALMKDPFWKTRGCDFRTLQDEMGKYKAKDDKDKPALPPRFYGGKK